MSAIAIPGIKDYIELPFRSIRLGSLRTFPIKLNDTSDPIVISEKGIKITVSLKLGK